MNRRGFLGVFVAAIVLRKIPVELSVPKAVSATRTLGFHVTQEIIDDDLYGTLRSHGRRKWRHR